MKRSLCHIALLFGIGGCCLWGFFSCDSATEGVNVPKLSLSRLSPSDTLKRAQVLSIYLQLEDYDANTDSLYILRIYPDISDSAVEADVQLLPKKNQLSYTNVGLEVRIRNGAYGYTDLMSLDLGIEKFRHGPHILRDYKLQFLMWAKDKKNNRSSNILTPAIVIKSH